MEVPDDAETKGLLPQSGSSANAVEKQFWWRLAHFVAYLCGGGFFVAGSACYYFPADFLGAIFYILGAIGLLTVDVMEYFAVGKRSQSDESSLRANISVSVFGSLLYLVGSVGYLPAVESVTYQIEIWGYILGSTFIVISQTAKVARILNSTGIKTPKQWSADTWSILGVEVSCWFGGSGYLFGTIIYAVAFPNVEGVRWYVTLALWETGSVAFTVAALFVGYRHFFLDL